MEKKIYKKVLLLIVLVGTSFSLFIPSVIGRVTYQYDHAIIQLRSNELVDVVFGWKFTFQASVTVRGFNPGTDYWRILGAYYSPSFMGPIWSNYAFALLDITYHDWYFYRYWVMTGVTYRVKVYDYGNPESYIIFDITAKVFAGGGTEVDFAWVKYQLNGVWYHYVEEIDYYGNIKEAIDELWIEFPPA